MRIELNQFSLLKEKLSSYYKVSGEITLKAEAAVAFVISKRNDSYEFLLIKRSFNKDDPWSGHYALPGGKKDPTDSSSLETAKRETFEEVGLNLELDDVEFLGALDQLQLKKNEELLPFVIHPFVFIYNGTKNLILDQKEVASAYWISFEEALSSKSFELRSFGLGQSSRELPCLNLSGKVVWGITFTILSDLFCKWEGLSIGNHLISTRHWKVDTLS